MRRRGGATVAVPCIQQGARAEIAERVVQIGSQRRRRLERGALVEGRVGLQRSLLLGAQEGTRKERGRGVTWDVLLWVEQVVVQGLIAPDDALLLVSLGVSKALGGARGAAEQTAEVGALLRRGSTRAASLSTDRPTEQGDGEF